MAVTVGMLRAMARLYLALDLTLLQVGVARGLVAFLDQLLACCGCNSIVVVYVLVCERCAGLDQDCG